MISDKNKLPEMIPLGKAKDLSKEKFGQLQPLYRCSTPEGKNPNNGAYWVCECDCGNYSIVCAKNLKSKNGTKTCGCSQGQKYPDDLTGYKFGRLIILKSNKQICTCQCECGIIKDIRRDGILEGRVLSCGCYQKEHAAELRKGKEGYGKKDLTGQRFGKLVVLEEDKSNEHRPSAYTGVIWKCKCDCGNLHYVASYHLLRGDTQSCGCIGKSLGEYIVASLLKNNNIQFEEQKKYDDCVFQDTKAKARYDFYLPEYNCLIEYDGIQHFKYFDDYGWNDKENFKKVQEHDAIKNQYCFDHNIPLIRIPYTHLSNITLEDLLPATSQFLLKATE